MANLKNKKSNVAKKTTTTTAKTTPVQAAQAAVTSTKDVAKTVETKAEVKQAATPKKEETLKDTKPVADKKTPAKQVATKKAVEKKVTKRTRKPVETVQEVFYEYAGEQILTEELVERIKQTYKNEGHRVGAIKSLRVYINPEERKAYYVINDKAEGKFVEF